LVGLVYARDRVSIDEIYHWRLLATALDGSIHSAKLLLLLLLEIVDIVPLRDLLLAGLVGATDQVSINEEC